MYNISNDELSKEYFLYHLRVPYDYRYDYISLKPFVLKI